jgi:hypothetical protein
LCPARLLQLRAFLFVAATPMVALTVRAAQRDEHINTQKKKKCQRQNFYEFERGRARRASCPYLQ